MTRSASQSVSSLLPTSWLTVSLEDFFPLPSSATEAYRWLGPELHVSSSGYKLFLRGGPSADLTHVSPKAVCFAEHEVPGMISGLKKVAVSFDSGLALSSIIQIPRTSKGRVGRILAIRREQYLPVPKGSYIYGWFEKEVTADTTKRLVNQIIVKREWVEHVLRLFGNTKPNCEMLLVREGLAKALPMAWSANGSNYRSTEITRWKMFFRLSLISLLVGISSMGLTSVFQIGQRSDSVEKQIELLQPEANRLSKIRRKQVQLHNQIEKIALAVSPKFLVSRQIEKLAGLLADDVALTGLSFDRGTLMIEGVALAPESLIQLLNDGDDFNDVSLSAPVFRNPGETKSRFVIRMQVSGFPK